MGDSFHKKNITTVGCQHHHPPINRAMQNTKIWVNYKYFTNLNLVAIWG
jgi:hypothetical protein